MAVTLYHTKNARSVRIRWALEELDVPHTLVTLAYQHGGVGGEAYQQIHPLQRVPTMMDGDAVIFESLAALEYIARRHGGDHLIPGPDDREHAHFLQWFHFGEAGVGQYVNMLMGHSVLLPEDKRVPGIAAWAASETQKFFAFFDEHGLGDKDTVCARGFTLADISVTYMLLLLKLMRRFDLVPERTQAYWKRMVERPAWAIASAD